MEIQSNLFWNKWMKNINRSTTIIKDEFKNFDDELIIPFRNKKHTIGDRILCRKILFWCCDNNIECHQIDYFSDYEDKEYNALHIKFAF